MWKRPEKMIKQWRYAMRILLGAAIGAAIGFAIGYFGRCSSGTCPLTSSPWTSLAIGTIMGIVATLGR